MMSPPVFDPSTHTFTVVDTSIDQATGSTSVFLKDDEEHEHHLYLNESDNDPDRLPMRFYLNEVIIPLLSKREGQVLEALENAAFDQEHDRGTIDTMRAVVSTTVARLRQPGLTVRARKAFKNYKPHWPNPNQDRVWEEPTE